MDKAEAEPEVTELPIDQLLLDKANPRLASLITQDEPTQDDLVQVLWTEMAVDEVAFSVAANGFYPNERLLLVKERGATKFTVIEGNRRLAAVRLLRDERLRTKVGATSLPSITSDLRKTLGTLPVEIYPNRKALWAYLGFRHINGTKPWDAYSKAQYVAQVHEDYDEPLEEIARRIGDRHSTVVRLFHGYQVLRQAERKAGFDKEDRTRNRFHFSHLYTAVDQPEFRGFLGITDDRWKKSDPVPKGKLPELKELVVWLYGQKSAGLDPLIRSQNPDLNKLRRIVGSKSSVAALRSGYSLDTAHDISIGDRQRFRDAIVSAKEELQKAKGTVTTGYAGDEDLLTMAEGIVDTSRRILDEMKEKARLSAEKRKNK